MLSSTATLDTLLAEYVAGGLPRPVEVMVSAYLELNPASRDWARYLEAIGGEVLDRLAPIALSTRDQRLREIFSLDADPTPDAGLRSLIEPTSCAPAPASGLPHCIECYLGRSLDDIPWKTRMPGFRVWRALTEDGYAASLVCVRAGRGLPAHTHEGNELSLVLKGGFSDVTGHYGVGDLSVADRTIDHRPVADKDEDCIGYLVTNAPVRYTGPLRRLWGAARSR